MSRGAGKVRYSADSMDGELELTGGQATASSRVRARRLGAC